MNENKKTSLRVKILQQLMAYAAIVLLLLVHSLKAQGQINNNLVNVDWLEAHLNDPDVLILDASFPKIYSEKHIPGAANVNLFSYGALDKPLNEMEQLLQSYGISPEKNIVIYDQGGTFLATNLFYTLYYYGFPAENLLILDGGLFKWLEKGSPTTKDIPQPKNGTFAIKDLNEDAKIKLSEFISASGDLSNNALVEAVGPDWHFGQTKFFDRAGHIPNAISFPAPDFFNPDKTFRSPEEIQKMASYLGIKINQKVLTHCGGGIAASVPFFAFKFILKYPDVKLFKESQIGWLSDERELPFWTYDAPFLMRESDWLQFWGGQTSRMYGISQVSIIDVRPAVEFAKGHLPFAINISADVFKNNINNYEDLAKIIGVEGVNATHEAVIVSGAGLTKESALAFAVLEKLGQKNASIFMDSFDKWIQLGSKIITDTVKKVSNDMPAVTYSSNLREDVIINDPESTSGDYPKILIASGRNAPSEFNGHKVVHIPYTDLLNADGTPKPAKDILTILTGAGIPRYAELVCFSDDPGEAALNYFIFKLMGYPDIKILLMK